ncbi:MAG TPA: saccharopine dehydrogenase C-terminal domain-containing protein [Kiritimatiellia bacterium]|nr:homospermidine synthase [Lentisphaerota bacterium]HOU21496.1 saccharopine dehydrogenase C-terminal domain-containing protein [Kiritimatiellia bacterium]HPC18637.1 saccharopine dehydrogenase C-terminal domain-containing protein [Kiritimatiellia bacterium]HQN79735.1 saccharopine dehydrogenase C-terminal domain-containing protein [Kiritimatiellia bacterium]HQQ60457.1 saccharopine dehydrogenase C-terminal domain-containing protein [Kiritimatiellia bacterium]
MREFNGRIVITGFGVVAHAVLSLLPRHLRVPARRITVIDFADREDVLQPWIAKGLRFVRERITPLNLARLLSTHVEAGGLIIDLAWSIDCFDIMEWARRNGVLYINASLESWANTGADAQKTSLDKSLYARYAKLLQVAARRDHAPTALLDHGANPGLVSHFVKQGLLDIGQHVVAHNRMTRGRIRRLERLMSEEEFAELARALAVKVIHCSEWDRQRSRTPKRHDEFVGTWSVEGMWEESISPSELGWGTHEKRLPAFAIVPQTGPGNQIILPQMGLNTWVRSWVPEQEIVGMVVTHGEAFTISHFLTVRRRGRVVYRPTVHYAYMPANDTLASLHELRCRNYELQPRTRILTEEILDGEDLVGALIMGPLFQSWWTGSFLSIAEARRKAPHSNATALQVAAGVLAGLLWVVDNPDSGICLPEDLPHREILRHATPYLGRLVSQHSSWTPLQRHRVFFVENPDAQPDSADPWQFNNFRFHP